MKTSALMLSLAIVLSGCGSGEGGSSTTAPEICKGKSISLTGLRNNFDDEYTIDMQSERASALISLMARGNYSVLEMREVRRGGESYCKARVQIRGTHEGNSYDQVYWASAL